MSDKTKKNTTAGALLRKRVAATVSPAAAGPGWRALSEHFTELADSRSPRNDLNVLCAPGAGEGIAPGYYMPATARIALDGNILPVAPEMLDSDNDEHFAALAALQGLFVHELGHAVHTDAMRDSLQGDHSQTATLLEEIRMEAQAVRDREADSKWLRASATQLILNNNEDGGSVTEPQNLAHAARIAVLIEGRVVAGSLKVEDAAEVSRVLEGLFDEDQIKELRSILSDTVEVADGDCEAMDAVSKRFRELMGEDAEQPEGGSGSGSGEGAPGAPGEGGTVGQIELSKEEAEELAAAAKEAAEKAEAEGAGELAESSEGGDVDQAVEVVIRDPEVAEKLDREAPDESPETVSHGCSPVGTKGVRYRERNPRSEERAQRNKLAALLRKARYRDRTRTTVASVVPPGRIRTREAMRGSAERSMGRMVSAKPWRKTQRKVVEQPKLRVAVMCDVSGSMGPYVEGIASSMWVIANAVADTGGTSIGIAFGDEARSVIEAGKPPRQVMEFPADGGFESIGSGIQMADNSLGLSDPTNPRLMVIVSDGHWVNGRERDLADEEIIRLRALGVKVIQVGLERTPVEHNPDVTVTISQPTELAELVGGACVEALRGF